MFQKPGRTMWDEKNIILNEIEVSAQPLGCTADAGIRFSATPTLGATTARRRHNRFPERLPPALSNALSGAPCSAQVQIMFYISLKTLISFVTGTVPFAGMRVRPPAPPVATAKRLAHARAIGECLGAWHCVARDRVVLASVPSPGSRVSAGGGRSAAFRTPSVSSRRMRPHPGSPPTAADHR